MEQSLLRQLISEAKTGDIASFEKIVILHERLVLRVAQRLLLNSEDAKDAAQEVFLRLHNTLSRFDEEREIGPWLYRLTVNICRDLRRRSQRELTVAMAPDPPAGPPDPEQSAVTGQRYQFLLDSLVDLSPREREAIVLRDLEGRSTSEVAQILGSSEGTVRSQLSTGRVKMKNYIMAKSLKNRTGRRK